MVGGTGPALNWTGLPQVQIAEIQFEALLGLWLLWGAQLWLAWLVSLVFFAAAALLNVDAMRRGLEFCDCFGVVHSSPRASLGLDLALVASLAWFRPQRPGWAQTLRALRTAGAVAGGAALLLAVAGAVFAGVMGRGTAQALVAIRGEALAVDPAFVSVGEGLEGASGTFEVALASRTERPLRILGMRSCACAPATALPLVIQPREIAAMTFRFGFPDRPGGFTGRLLLYTDDPRQPVVGIGFSGRALERSLESVVDGRVVVPDS